MPPTSDSPICSATSAKGCAVFNITSSPGATRLRQRCANNAAVNDNLILSPGLLYWYRPPLRVELPDVCLGQFAKPHPLVSSASVVGSVAVHEQNHDSEAFRDVGNIIPIQRKIF